MFIGYQKVLADSTVKTATSLTIPTGSVGVSIMAADNDIRYTMDATTTPTTDDGMILMKGESPITVMVNDLRRIKFTQGIPSNNAYLLLHYFN